MKAYAFRSQESYYPSSCSSPSVQGRLPPRRRYRPCTPASISSVLCHCLLRCMLLSIQSSCQKGRNDTAGNGNVDHSLHRAGRHRRGVDLDMSLRHGRRASERSRTSILRIALLHIAQPLCKKFDWYIIVILQKMLLGHRPCIVYQRVRIGCDACDAPDHISVECRDQEASYTLEGSAHEFNKNIFSPLPP
jgi:hypothetical protein